MENSLQKAHCAQRREEIAHRLVGGTLCTLPLWYVESSPGPLPPASPATSSWPRFSQAVPTLATQPYSRTHKLSSIGSSFRYKYNLEKTTHLDPRSPPRKTPKSGSAAEPEKHGSLGKLSKPHYELWLSERRRRVAGPGSGAKCTAARPRAAIEVQLSGSLPAAPLARCDPRGKPVSWSPFLLSLCSRVGLQQSHDALNWARRTISS